MKEDLDRPRGRGILFQIGNYVSKGKGKMCIYNDQNTNALRDFGFALFHISCLASERVVGGWE